MKYITFLFCLTLMFACTKNDNGRTYNIKGQVVEYGTEEPVANALVYATGYTGDDILMLLDSTRSDINGEYELKATGFAVNALAAKNGYDGRNSELPVNDDGSYRNLTLTLDPYAWLDVTLKNVSGAYELGYALNASEFENVAQGDVFHRFHKVLGNRDIFLSIGRTSSLGYESLSQDVYCPGKDTTQFYLEY